MSAPSATVWVTILTVLVSIAAVCVLAYPCFGPRLPWERDNLGILVRIKKRRERLLRAIKDAEFEHQTGLLADEEFRAMRNGLKLKAVAVTRELEQARLLRLKSLQTGARGVSPSQRKRVEDLVAKRALARSPAQGAKGV